MSAHHYY